MRDTSLRAYYELVNSGKLTQRHKDVFEWLEKYGPCTARELHTHAIEDENVIEADLGGPNYVKPRLTELKQMNAIVENGKRECSVTGKLVYELEVNSEPTSQSGLGAFC